MYTSAFIYFSVIFSSFYWFSTLTNTCKYTSIEVHQSNWYAIAEHPRIVKYVLDEKSKIHYSETIIDNSRINKILEIIDKSKGLSKNELPKSALYDIRFAGIFKSETCVDTLLIDVSEYVNFRGKYFALNRQLAINLNVESYPINTKKKFKK
jgi:hypothetical protein